MKPLHYRTQPFTNLLLTLVTTFLARKAEAEASVCPERWLYITERNWCMYFNNNVTTYEVHLNDTRCQGNSPDGVISNMVLHIDSMAGMLLYNTYIRLNPGASTPVSYLMVAQTKPPINSGSTFRTEYPNGTPVLATLNWAADNPTEPDKTQCIQWKTDPSNFVYSFDCTQTAGTICFIKKADACKENNPCKNGGGSCERTSTTKFKCVCPNDGVWNQQDLKCPVIEVTMPTVAGSNTTGNSGNSTTPNPVTTSKPKAAEKATESSFSSVIFFLILVVAAAVGAAFFVTGKKKPVEHVKEDQPVEEEIVEEPHSEEEEIVEEQGENEDDEFGENGSDVGGEDDGYEEVPEEEV